MAAPRALHGSTLARGTVLVLALLAACGSSTSVVTRTVTTYVPRACAVSPSALATYTALGDYEPAASPPYRSLSAVGTVLTEIDTQARELVIGATQSDQPWEGLGPVPSSGGVNVLVLPTDTPCALTTSVGSRTGSTFALIGSQQALVVGGTSSAAPPTYVVHLDTGAVAQASPDLLTARTLASVTPFGDGYALVAGGVGGSVLLSDAEVYSVASGGFAQSIPPIQLGLPISQQGAVVLAGGQTLLVGGVTSTDGENLTVLDTMLTIDPAGPSGAIVRSTGLPQLQAARRDPSVMRLADGEVLVAGGFDQGGNAVGLLEWFDPTAMTSTRTPFPLDAGSARSFIALPQGGALAVIAPPSPAPADFQNVWLIDSTGVVTAATPIAGSLTNPILFGGAGGAPLLWTGDRWLQWSPWQGAFTAFTELGDIPTNLGDATCSPDPGLAMWLDATTFQPAGLRYATDNAYSPLGSPFIAAGTDATDQTPVGLAPDGLPGASGISYDPGGPTLTLPAGEGAFVTDRTYADVSISVSSPTGQLPVVVLRDDTGDELDVGAPVALCASCVACPLPATGTPASSLQVVRQAGAVTLEVASGQSATCSAPPFAAGARVSLGVRGQPDGPATVDALEVKRPGVP